MWSVANQLLSIAEMIRASFYAGAICLELYDITSGHQICTSCPQFGSLPSKAVHFYVICMLSEMWFGCAYTFVCYTSCSYLNEKLRLKVFILSENAQQVS